MPAIKALVRSVIQSARGEAMSRKKPKYWIVWDGTYSHIVLSKNEPSEDCGGPYDTFGEAKREIMNYYKNRVIDAKGALAELRRLKKAHIIEE